MPGEMFCLALHQNKDKEKGLKKALQAIVLHAFGDHREYNMEWCSFLKNPSGHNHVGLPDGRDLQGTTLEKY